MYSRRISFLFFTIMFLSVFFTYAQENVTDEQGRKQGKWVKYDKDVKSYEGEFKDDKPVGEFLRFYPNGKISSKSYFTEEGTKCYSEFYYNNENSLVKAKGNFINQKKDSLWLYYDKNGVLVSEESFKNGLADGIWNLYDYNGYFVKETPFKDGLKHGMQKEYFETGHLMRIMTYENDTLNGDFQVNSTEGAPMVFGKYKNDLRDKEWYYYDQNGEIKAIEHYEFGTLIKTTDTEGNIIETVEEIIDTVIRRMDQGEMLEMR